MAETLKERIAEEAKALGFDAVRFASADAVERRRRGARSFLADGRQGDMAWLATTAERRKAPRALWPEANSVILLGLNYGRGGDPLAVLKERSRGAISIYAQGADYHDVLKAKLKPLAARVQELTQGEVKIFVDTAPVMEKPLAARAGSRLAGQAHQSRLARVRIVALHRLDLHQRRDRTRRTRRRPLRGLPALPRCVPHQRLHRALPDRCARLHLLPHHRA